MDKDKQRINSLSNLLKIKRLDAVIFSHPENILLSTGMLPAAPFTISVITKYGRVLVICPWWRAEATKTQSWADAVYGFNWLRNLKAVDPNAAILGQLSKLAGKLKIKNIGFDNDFGCFMPSYIPSSFFTYGSIKSGLKDIFKKSTDVSSDIQQLRAVKTDYEIKMIRKADNVAKEAAKAFYKNAVAGVREIDVAAAILKTVQMQAGKNGIQFTYCDPPQITSGTRRTLTANALTCPATAKRLKEGELVMLELGGCADGYWFDITRCLVVGGKPKSIHNDMVEAIIKAAESTYTAYKNGQKKGAELAETAFKVLKNHGFKKGIVHGLGHGVGFAYHESLPGIRPGSQHLIKNGMITSMEPGLYLPGIGGIRIEENVLWKEKTVSVLTNFHKGLGQWKE
jgi:Xaa-Pro dipeptidase